MIYLIVAMCVSLIGVAIFCTLYSRADYGQGDGWGIGAVVSIVSAVLFGIFVLVIALSRPVGRSTCANWSKQTGITTKFTLLNAFDTGTCLARTPDGRWVQNTEWKAFINGSK